MNFVELVESGTENNYNIDIVSGGAFHLHLLQLLRDAEAVNNRHLYFVFFGGHRPSVCAYLKKKVHPSTCYGLSSTCSILKP